MSTVSAVGYGGPAVGGSYNGFYSSPAFGSNQVQEDPTQTSPFAPTGFTDAQGNQYIYVANGQGAYYLRDASPFSQAGSTANLSPTLQNDLAQRTTIAPTAVFSEDIAVTDTIGQTPIRDTSTPCLGYHYPAVDYIVNGLTINNCTLNIAPGTVLAFVGYPWEWGVRLNPGGRLNVNGAPTNRVTFARLEAVQEGPIGSFQGVGAFITSENFVFGSGPANPFSEIRIHYADFPTIEGAPNWHFGPLGVTSFVPDGSYGVIQDLELDGCLFQGGNFGYADDGPPGRTLTMRNTIFERGYTTLRQAGYAGWYSAQAYGADISAANNLFYQVEMFLSPIDGSGWTFVDNIFDNVIFDSNGPVGVNNHNAYVGMSGDPNGDDRLAPRDQESGSDPILSTLTYASGYLGRFYLPSTATALIGTGSRTAAAAGLYHFTSLTTNAKQAGGRVNIGSSYVALVSGAPADSNGDTVPDFIADANGNGLEESSEIPWTSSNNGTLSILSPSANSTLSGVVPLRVNLGANSATALSVAAIVDGLLLHESVLQNPATSCGQPEIDTKLLSYGTHSLSVEIRVPGPSSSRIDSTAIQSIPITVTTENNNRFPSWHSRADLAVSVNMQTSLTLPNYTLWLFNSAYAKAYNPFTGSTSSQGVTSGGSIDFSESPSNLGFGDGNTDPAIYTFTELTANVGGSPGTANDTTVANPNIHQDRPWTADYGLWVTAYAEDLIDYNIYSQYPCLDWEISPPATDRWYHEGALQYWFQCGSESSNGEYPSLIETPDPAGSGAQTWPMRGGFVSGNVKMYRDQALLKTFLSDSRVRNFYGTGHGSPYVLLGIDHYDYSKANAGRRYRFVFADGCDTASAPAFFDAFGAANLEVRSAALFQEILSQNPNGPPLSGPLQIADYETPSAQYPGQLGIRPSVFLGWRYPAVYGHSIPQRLDPNTGQLCSWDDYPALAHWHQLLIINWRENHYSLLDSINMATSGAAQTGSYPAWIANDPVGTDSNGQTINFSVPGCLVICGYGQIGFNFYNHPTDTW